MFRTSLIVLALFANGAMSQTSPLGHQKNQLPEIGVVASNAISIDRERTIGDAYMRQLRAQAPIVNDPLLEEYLQDLGNRLVTQADNVKFPFRFFWINNSDINAFAFFGGHVAVHTGLLIAADNESELASVLAHEITHVTQRHIARSIEASQNNSPLQMLSMLGGVLVSMANPEAGMAILGAGMAGAQQAAINYTRDNEKEADRIGIQMLSKSGFDPNAAGTFFGKLAERYRYKSKPPAFLLTHPLPESRIADARSRAGMYAVPPQSRQVSESFALAKVRVLARYSDDVANNRDYFEKLQNHPLPAWQQAGTYGLVLLDFADEKYAQAEKTLAGLLAAQPDNLFFIDAMTDILLEQKRVDDAIALLDPMAKRMPRNRVVSLNLANALIKGRQYERAIALLKDYLLINPEHTLSYQLLADAYSESKQKMEMHQARAEFFALLSVYPKAIDELQTAYNFTGEQRLEQQRIRARIDQLREAERKLKSL